MAIGSQPTIGDTFSTRDDFESEEALWEWYALWRENVGPDLLGGYAQLDYPKKYLPSHRKFSETVDGSVNKEGKLET